MSTGLASLSMARPGTTGAVLTSTLGRKRPDQFHQSQFYTKPFDTAYAELARARNLRKLETLFISADTDGSGEMSFDEFREALRIPRIQRAFSVLGVQPHQSEPIFRYLEDRHPSWEKNGELTITVFMEGLTELVGTNIGDGSGKELDVETLRPAYKAKVKYHSHYMPRAKTAVSGTSNSKLTRSNALVQAASILDLGPVHLLPEAKVQRAFVHSASAQALHAAVTRSAIDSKNKRARSIDAKQRKTG